MGTLLVLLLACTGVQDPALPSETDAPSKHAPAQTRTWRRAPDFSTPDVEQVDTHQRCGPTSRCTVESWTLDSAPPIHLIRAQRAMWRAGTREEWRTRWRGLAGPLDLCIGDPLALPPADDPGGFRLLHDQQDSWRWSVHLSGANACELEGHLEIDALADRIQTHHLRVDGMAWTDGGRELARERGRELARAIAESRWAEASAEERARIIAALKQDPDSAALVARLLSGD